MKIKYRVFKELSKSTQDDVVDFGYNCLKWIEQFGDDDTREARIHDYGRGVYNLHDVYSHANLLNKCFERDIIEMSNSPQAGTGMERRLTVDLILTYQKDTYKTLKDFLKKVTPSSKNEVNIVNVEKRITVDVENQTLWYGDKFCKFMQNGTKKNKRFEIVKMVIQKRTPAAKLGKNTQYVSNQVNDINDRLKKKFGIDEDYIVNENNSGYEVNRKYRLV
jgi:hypothetical protein